MQGKMFVHGNDSAMTSFDRGAKKKKKKEKRMDAVGIEPTTFHMCEDAKRLKLLLVECSD